MLEGSEQRVGAGELLYLEDAAGRLDFEQARARLQQGAFEALAAGGGNFGITDSAYWLYFRMSNPGATPRLLVVTHEYAPTDSVDLHLVDAQGEVVHHARGDSVAPDSQAPRRRLAVFPVELAPGATAEAYVRIRSSSNLNAELRLWEPQAFEHREGLLTLLYGLLFGMLLASVIYLLLAYRAEGERGVLVAVPYLLCFALYLGFLNGFWPIYWPPGGLAWINPAHYASLGLLFAFGARFYRTFLKLDSSRLRWLDRSVQVLQWAAVTMLFYPVLPLPLLTLTAAVVTGLGPVFTSGCAFWLMWRRHPQAGVFAIGWAVAHASALAGMLRVSGALPNSDLLLHLPGIGCACALVFFGRAISDQLALQRRKANEDFLTGACNRRRFEERGAEEFERARRYHRPLSLIILDVDHFKSINDTLGHAGGDQVLRRVADTCRAQLRTTDLLARIGGEEFVLLLVETDTESARDVAERLRVAQGSEPILGRRVTVSCGVAELAEADAGIEDTLRRADAALYSAKNAGRDRVCVAGTADAGATAA